MKKTVAELFAGVGGFRVGLNNIRNFDEETGLAIENNDWDFVWANQWEPSTKRQHAFECYVTRFGPKGVSNQDINTVNKNEIPNHALLVGGFPCQDYSVARTKSNEKGIRGKKGVLFWDIAETLEVKQTPFFLLENVDRLLKSPALQRGRDFGIMLRTLSNLGYDVEWRVINAADYGRAQRRRRVFIFGWKRDTKFAKGIKDLNLAPINFVLQHSLFARTFPVESLDSSLKKYINDINLNNYKDTVEMTANFKFGFENSGVIIDGNVTTLRTNPILENPIKLGEILERDSDKSNYILNKEQIKKFTYLKGGKSIERKKPNGEVYFYSEGSMSETDSLDLPGRTMLTSEGNVNRSTHILIDPVLNVKRFITPIEAERLQDFPDNWTDTDMPFRRRYFMMGNALVTGIINRLEHNLSVIIENE